MTKTSKTDDSDADIPRCARAHIELEKRLAKQCKRRVRQQASRGTQLRSLDWATAGVRYTCGRKNVKIRAKSIRMRLILQRHVPSVYRADWQIASDKHIRLASLSPTLISAPQHLTSSMYHSLVLTIITILTVKF